MKARFVFESLNEAVVSPYEYQKFKYPGNLGEYYRFNTEDDDKYTVKFFNMFGIHKQKKYEDYYQVEFGTSGDDGDKIVVNKGRFYKVISTVISVIEEFMKEKDPRILKMSPTSNFKGDKRRKNIYIYYLEKMLPNNYKYDKSLLWNDLYIKKKS